MKTCNVCFDLEDIQAITDDNQGWFVENALKMILEAARRGQYMCDIPVDPGTDDKHADGLVEMLREKGYVANADRVYSEGMFSRSGAKTPSKVQRVRVFWYK